MKLESNFHNKRLFPGHTDITSYVLLCSCSCSYAGVCVRTRVCSGQPRSQGPLSTSRKSTLVTAGHVSARF